MSLHQTKNTNFIIMVSLYELKLTQMCNAIQHHRRIFHFSIGYNITPLQPYAPSRRHPNMWNNIVQTSYFGLIGCFICTPSFYFENLVLRSSQWVLSNHNCELDTSLFKILKALSIWIISLIYSKFFSVF
jgi:hypothetical protein